MVLHGSVVSELHSKMLALAATSFNTEHVVLASDITGVAEGVGPWVIVLMMRDDTDDLIITVDKNNHYV